jgi:hypothetical protein
MLIWRGHGYWVFLLPLSTLGVFVHADKSLPAFAANKRLWIAAGLASAGLVCTLWGLLANRGGAAQAAAGARLSYLPDVPLAALYASTISAPVATHASWRLRI